MPTYFSAVPAYGRDYKSKAAVMAAWNAGQDFQIQHMGGSAYINKDDKPAHVILNIRYSNLMKVCVIK